MRSVWRYCKLDNLGDLIMNKKIINKTTYGGTLVDKYFLVFDDGTDLQVSFSDWDKYEIDDEYPFLESFDKAVKDIEEGKTVPLDTALNEEPPTESETFKKICKEIQELFDKISALELRNHVLIVANEDLDKDFNRALKAWTEAVTERTEALLERDKYKIGYDRYEKLRRLNLREIKELYLKNLRTGENFDTLVDQLK